MSKTNEEDAIRPCAVCGQFYPADRDSLLREVQDMLGDPRLRKGEPGISGMIAPHAGYLYSGPTAAAGYALVSEAKYETVVIISPSHREVFPGVSVYPGAAYQTPLGTLAIDAELRRQLIDTCPLVSASEAGHREEHAIEVQLPFLQETVKEFRLLPLVIGRQSRETCFALGEALASVLRGRAVLVVASTDLSHYHPARVAEDLDAVSIRDILAMDEERLMEDLEEGRTEACGGGPAVAALRALKSLGAARARIVKHCTSGDVTGDRRSVVGYLSAAIFAQ